MTAFKEVMAAEQEAEQAIAQAKNEVEAAVAQARTAGKEHREAEQAALEAAAVKALQDREAEVADMVKKIESDTDIQVAAITQRFGGKRSELQRVLLQHFQ